MRHLKRALLTAPNRREMFFLGMTLAFVLLSLIQDFIGQEVYIQLVRDHWVPGAVAVPLCIIAFLYIVFRLAIPAE